MNMKNIAIGNIHSMTNSEFKAIPDNADLEIDSSSWEMELHTPEEGDRRCQYCLQEYREKNGSKRFSSRLLEEYLYNCVHHVIEYETLNESSSYLQWTQELPGWFTNVIPVVTGQKGILKTIAGERAERGLKQHTTS